MGGRDEREHPLDEGGAGAGPGEASSSVSDGDPSAPLNVPPPPTSRVFSARQVGRVRELLTRLYALRRAARFYPVGHPAVDDAVSTLLDAISSYHAEGVDVPLVFYEGEVLLGEQFLPEESLLFDQLVRDVGSMGAGSITFKRGLTREELERAVPVLAAEPAAVEAAGGAIALAEDAGLDRIEFGAVRVTKSPPPSAGDAEAARAAYAAAIELMRELERVIRTNQVTGAGQVRGVVRSLVDNVLANRQAMLELTGLKSYDEYTFYHSVNVSILSLALGSVVTRDHRFLSSLGVGALLHDIGKMTIDLDILNKPGSLTPEEWASVRMHPVYGAETAARMPGLDKAAVVTILEHHMRHDLTGYPRPASERRQHVASRIVAVCDAYDAMTSRRSYSAARLQDEAMSLLAKNSGAAFDPALVRLFIGVLGVYPPRSVVRFESGEVGVVVGPSVSDPLRPRVRVIAGMDGGIVEPFDVDLSRDDSGRAIQRCLDPEGLNVDVGEYL
ncbi:MAG: HD domain-containing protein [Coriobacteriia bacterium]|nr:HD domain-containing protein [Coriobacteriia bacterium]